MWRVHIFHHITIISTPHHYLHVVYINMYVLYNFTLSSHNDDDYNNLIDRHAYSCQIKESSHWDYSSNGLEDRFNNIVARWNAFLLYSYSIQLFVIESGTHNSISSWERCSRTKYRSRNILWTAQYCNGTERWFNCLEKSRNVLCFILTYSTAL